MASRTRGKKKAGASKAKAVRRGGSRRIKARRVPRVELISAATLPKGFTLCGGGCNPPTTVNDTIFCPSTGPCSEDDANCSCHMLRASFGSTTWEYVAGPNQPKRHGDKERDYTYICVCGTYEPPTA